MPKKKKILVPLNGNRGCIRGGLIEDTGDITERASRLASLFCFVFTKELNFKTFSKTKQF